MAALATRVLAAVAADNFPDVSHETTLDPRVDQGKKMVIGRR
jgi:hypothetical protein